MSHEPRGRRLHDIGTSLIEAANVLAQLADCSLAVADQRLEAGAAGAPQPAKLQLEYNKQLRG